jgi:ATP-binding cassette subfamily B protein
VRWQHYRRLLRDAKPYWKKLVLAFTGAIIVAVIVPVIPLFVRAVIDKGINHHHYKLVGKLVAAMLAISVVKAVGFGARRQMAGEISIGIEGDLRQRIYNHVQALDAGYHERVSTGQIMSRATSDIQAIRQYMMSLGWSVTLVLQVIAMFVVMFVIAPELAIIFLIAAPFVGYYTYRFADRFDPVVWRMQQNLGEFAAVVEETVVGIRIVKAFGREKDQVRKLTKDADAVFDAAMESIDLRARFVPFFNLVPTLGLAAVLWIGGRLAIHGHLTAGTIVALFQYLFLMIQPLRSIGMIIAWGQRAVTASTRIYEILETEPGIADHDGATKLEVSGAHVRYEDVHFAYPDGGPVLDGVTLDVPGGSSIALVGQTGCGKSTLMRLLPRFIEPSRGTVTIDGQNVSEVTLRSLRKHIGIVFEDTLLFSDTIASNIAFGRPGASEEEIVRAAAIAQAHEFIQELPEGYDTIVGEHGYTLSGGQRQRIAIARAILLDPSILILDDATSNVDARVEAAIRKGLVQAMKGRTTIIVARRPQTAALADRVAFMDGGRIVDVGTHADLWRDNPVYRETLLSSVGVDEIKAQQEVERV